MQTTARLLLLRKKKTRVARDAKSKVLFTGFIAQEVAQAANEIGYDFSGVDLPKNENDLYGIRYAEFVVPVIKAVQELDQYQKTEMESLRTENEQLKKDIADIKKALGMKSDEAAEKNALVVDKIQDVLQVSPNPFSDKINVTFTVDEKASAVSLLISDASGRLVQSVNITERGKVKQEISTAGFASGIYYCKLVVDGKQVGVEKISCIK